MNQDLLRVTRACQWTSYRKIGRHEKVLRDSFDEMIDVSESTGIEGPGDVSAGTSKNDSDKEMTGWGSKQKKKQKNSYWPEDTT